MLEKIAENVWSVPAPLAVFNLLHLNTRMTVIRLEDGTIWLHSLIPYSFELAKEIEALGTIQYLVAPSCFHHLFVGEWIEKYPEARSFGAKGLHKKRADLNFTKLLTDDLEKCWPEEIHYLNLQGVPATNECVFYHKPSQTLVVTDLLFYMPKATGFTKFYAKLWMNGFYDKIWPSALYRTAIKDKGAFRACLETIKQWNIQQLALCHHTIPADNVQEQISKALDSY